MKPQYVSKHESNSTNIRSDTFKQVNTEKDSPSENYPICRICHEGAEEGKLFSPCKCSGSIKYVHVTCLEKWRELSTNPQSVFRCDACKYQYNLYRPKISELLQNEHVITGTTIAAVSILTLGSGSAVVLLSGERWQFKDSFLCGLVAVGIVGLAPKLPLIIREVLNYRWQLYKRYPRDWLLETVLGLLSVGIFAAATEVYQKIRTTSKYLAKKLGERVLEVKSEDDDNDARQS